MLGEMKFYNGAGEFVVHVNGGHLTIRRADEKPYQARKIDSSHPMWQMVYGHLHQINDIIEAYQRAL